MASNEEYDYLFKIALIGDPKVGKTSLLKRYLTNEVPKESGPSIGMDFVASLVNLASGTTVKA